MAEIVSAHITDWQIAASSKVFGSPLSFGRCQGRWRKARAPTGLEGGPTPPASLGSRRARVLARIFQVDPTSRAARAHSPAQKRRTYRYQFVLRHRVRVNILLHALAQHVEGNLTRRVTISTRINQPDRFAVGQELRRFVCGGGKSCRGR
jgi:hypothetical protein